MHDLFPVFRRFLCHCPCLLREAPLTPPSRFLSLCFPISSFNRNVVPPPQQKNTATSSFLHHSSRGLSHPLRIPWSSTTFFSQALCSRPAALVLTSGDVCEHILGDFQQKRSLYGSLNAGPQQQQPQSDAEFAPRETIRGVSSAATPINRPVDESVEKEVEREGGREADGRMMNIEFDSSSFRDVGTAKLIGTVAIFMSCRIQYMVNNADKVISLCRRVMGNNATEMMLKLTFFAHFCGGVKAEDVAGTVDYLRKKGVGSILDYAAEMDVTSASTTTPTESRVEEAAYERNLAYAIHAAKCSASQSIGFAAVKVTGLTSPELLQSASKLILSSQDLFSAFSHYSPYSSSFSPGSRPLSLHLSRSQFLRAAESILSVSEKEAEKVFADIKALGPQYQSDVLEGDSISLYGWMEHLAPHRISRADGGLRKWRSSPCPCSVVCANRRIGETGGELPRLLTTSEGREWEKLGGRVAKLHDCAREFVNVSVLVDAEQTYLQPAIDYITLKEQQRCNGERAVVYNTYQAYLKGSKDRLTDDLQRADDLGYRSGVKLVRGAYMVQERALSASGKYPSPIHDDIASSHNNFDECVAMLIAKLKHTDSLLGTHNENSVKKALLLLQEHGIAKTEDPVSFGQLLGMCDHVTLTLGQHGYRAFKYVPYGPVNEVLAFLIRRAQENSSLLSSSNREVKLISEELWHRANKSMPARLLEWARRRKTTTEGEGAGVRSAGGEEAATTGRDKRQQRAH